MGTLPSDRMSTVAVFNPYANGIEDLESDNEGPFSSTLSQEQVSRKRVSEQNPLPASGEGNMNIATTTLEPDENMGRELVDMPIATMETATEPDENIGRKWVDMTMATMETATPDEEIGEDDDQVCYLNILLHSIEWQANRHT
jgi:hypothetical protein